MGSLWEILVVIAIVGVAAIWLVRSLWKAVRAKKVCATCGDAASCPLARNPELVDQLVGMGETTPNTGSEKGIPCSPSPDSGNRRS